MTVNARASEMLPAAGNCQMSKSAGRIGTTGDDPNRREGIYRFAALVVGRPFDLRDSLRFGPRWNQFYHFALDMEYVARPYRQHPAQVIDAKPHERMRSEWPDFNREAHRNGRRVPTRCRESFERCFLSGGFIQMERLRIEFGQTA